MFICRPTWMLGLTALFSAGCALRGDVDMLESELRRQETVQQDLAAELQSARDELRVARADADNLRSRLAGRGQMALASEQAEVLYKAEAIKFNALLTGGFNRDGQPGDEGFSVLILPVDSAGDLVKLVGAIELELFDLTREPDQQRLGRWQFSADEVRERWHKGFLSAGYLFRLDWQQPPLSTDLTLHGRLIAPDGRRFDATTQLKVSPPGTGAPQTPIAQAPANEPAPMPAVNPARFDAPAAPAAAARKPTVRPGTSLSPADRPGHAPIRTSDRWPADSIPQRR
ncbi:MAG: hypothetical protein ACT4QC_01115 [Planctomycetaceae bacterium]